MNSLAHISTALPAMTERGISDVRRLEALTMELPQVDIQTAHKFHAGIYSRTIFMPAGCVITGALIKIPTTLITSGELVVYIGEEAVQLNGYNVLPAAANRKQAFYALTDSYLTMFFATDAQSIEEAESQFTDEADMLLSRRQNGGIQ